MKVSVVISNYNYAQFLPMTVESVLTQTYQDFEVIIVDDGSTDNSQDIIKILHKKHSNKIIYIFQENQGQGAAFNSAFAVLSGDIVAFLDADDVWSPDKLEQVVKCFKRNNNTVGVMHPLKTIDYYGDTVVSSNKHWIPNQPLSEVILKTGNAWYYPPTSGLTYRREILATIFPIDQNKWRLCADGCLVYCTAFLGNVIGIDQSLGSYRIHGSNNHANSESSLDKLMRSQAGVEMTNRYINDFLKRIEYSERVNLLQNLSYRRLRYYLNEKWDFSEAIDISLLILNWHFYTFQEKIIYLTRFWLKSSRFLIKAI